MSNHHENQPKTAGAACNAVRAPDLAPPITKEAGQEYTVGYSSVDDGEQPEGEIKDVETILEGLHYMAGRGNLSDGNGVVTSVKVKNPSQVLTAILNSEGGRTPYALKQEDMPESTATDGDGEEDDTGSYDMTVNAKVVRCVTNKYWLNDDDMDRYANWGGQDPVPGDRGVGNQARRRIVDRSVAGDAVGGSAMVLARSVLQFLPVPERHELWRERGAAGRLIALLERRGWAGEAAQGVPRVDIEG